MGGEGKILAGQVKKKVWRVSVYRDAPLNPLLQGWLLGQHINFQSYSACYSPVLWSKVSYYMLKGGPCNTIVFKPVKHIVN